MNSKIRFVSILFLFLLVSSVYSQEVGEVFSAQEANNNFGKVLESYSVSTSTVRSWLNSTDDKIMFLLKNGMLTVLGDDRVLIYSNTQYSETSEVFHLYSKSKVAELLYKGGNSTTNFENRENVFTINNGNYTLEISYPCPPHCD